MPTRAVKCQLLRSMPLDRAAGPGAWTLRARSGARQHRLQLLQPFAPAGFLVLRLLGLQRRACPAQVVLRKLREKPRRLALAPLAGTLALARERQVQGPLRARDAHVHEA